MDTNDKINGQLPADEIDLIQFVRIFWKNKWLIFSMTIIFAIGSVFYAKSLPNIYRSEVLLAPVSDSQGSGSQSQLSGLAALAGISIGTGAGVEKSALAIETLKSREFLNQFISQHEILPLLLAVKDWDKNGQPIFDENIYNASTKKWIENSNSKIPSKQIACNSLLSMISILPDKTRMYRISIEHSSPEIAKQWVTWLVDDINAMMKKKDMEEAEKSISYLENQLSKTNIADVRTILYQLIEEQTKTMMLVNVRNEYIFKTIDPAIAPEVRSKPQRARICLIGTALGILMGMGISFLRYQFSK